MMFKNNFKAVLIMMAFTASLFSQQAQAREIDLTDFLDDTGGATWEAAGRKGVSFGRGTVNLAKPQAIVPISLSKPNIAGGCNGISWTLGGISVMDGEEIVNFIQNVAGSLKGVIAQELIDLVSEKLGSTFKQATNYARNLSAMSLDSCRAAKALVKTGKSINEPALAGECSLSLVSTRSVSDLASGNSKCDSLKNIWNTLEENYKGTTEEKKYNKLIYPNLTYKIISDYFGGANVINDDPSKKMAAELMLSVFGTYSYGKRIEPTINIENLRRVLLCPKEDDEIYLDSRGKNICNEINDDKLLYSCRDAAQSEHCATDVSSEKDKLASIGAQTIKDFREYYNFNGFLLLVKQTLSTMLQNIDAGKPANTPPPSPPSTGEFYGLSFNDRVNLMLSLAPFDLFRAINATVPFRNADTKGSENSFLGQIILENSGPIAEKIVESYIRKHSLMIVSARLQDVEGFESFIIYNETDGELEKAKFKTNIKKSESKLYSALKNELDFYNVIMGAVKQVEEKVAATATYRRMKGASEYSVYKNEEATSP